MFYFKKGRSDLYYDTDIKKKKEKKSCENLLKEEVRQLNALPDPRLDHELEEENFYKGHYGTN